MVKLRRISLIESYIFESKDLTLEAKKDLEDLKSYLGDDLFDSYMKIRDRISDPNFKDFSKLKKMDKKDIKDFVDSFQSKSDKKKKDKQEGAKKLYEDDEWVVYRITTYPAAQLYGKGTEWCITGRYPGHEERGQKYFDAYIEDNNLDGGYYFYLNKKDPSEKYCVLQTKDKKIHSIWDAEDTDRGKKVSNLGVFLPKVKGVKLKIYDPEDIVLFSEQGNLDNVQLLLNNGVDPNTQDDNGNTSLIESSDNGYKDIVELLLKYGADPNIKNNNNVTSLISASICGKKDIIELLLKNGADVNALDIGGCTSLLYASRRGYNDIVKLLLEYGADFNIQEYYDGETPLFAASDRGYKDIVKLLLEYGADPNIKNRNGDSPLSVSYNEDIKELLKKYGAK